MDFNRQNLMTYKANKIASKTHNSIFDMLNTRMKLENFFPTITMLDKDYSRRIFVDCSAYYTQSGYDFLQVEKVDAKNQRLVLKVDYPKLDKYLDDDNNEEFASLDQALSILALGNPIEILKSEPFIERTLRHNKHIKKMEIGDKIYGKNGRDIQEMADKFKSFDEEIRAILSLAHRYIEKNPTL